MSRNSGDESGATNGEGASAQEGQSDGQFGGLTPERRLQELQAEMERLLQMISGSSQRSMPEFGRRDPCSELRRYSKVLSGVLPKFPTEAEAPVWFGSVESALEAYGVPREFWGLLVFPLVAARVPYLSTRLSPAQHRDYSVIKETVLDELKLSAGEYLKRFLGSEKRANEGWRPFATRLQSYLHFYLGAREVSTFEALVELLVADQLKRNLSEEARRYVTLQEGRKWMNAPEITAFLRTFEEAQGANSAAKQVRQRAAESPEHAAEEEAPAECSAVGPAATQSVVQECCGTDIVGQNRCSESLHENLEWRDKIKSEDASLVEMLAKDRRCADNRCTGAGVEVSGKYWELLGSTPAVTSVGQHEIGPQKGLSPGKALESAQVVVEREGTSKSEKDQVVPSARYCFRNSAGVGCRADDPGKLADSGEREAPTAEAQCRGMPGCGYEQGVLPRHAAVRRHLAELAGVRVPNGIPGYAVADRVSPRFRAALRETAASAMIDIEKPSWLCTLASAVSAGTCLPQRAERVTDAPGMFSRQGFSPTQVSCPAVGAGIWVI
ncbi:hypothetical protein HPB50_020134 [Hyalomma asiaticum]|uniref:Uncharacterized protein n=1 Tax=Hyalomma asiaticum TaxID=266040 RepID=A0ACB7S6M5_HYAAI|nr:hypothetical protein HPB50_020134 [Hyalomma asiaticum]